MYKCLRARIHLKFMLIYCPMRWHWFEQNSTLHLPPPIPSPSLSSLGTCGRWREWRWEDSAVLIKEELSDLKKQKSLPEALATNRFSLSRPLTSHYFISSSTASSFFNKQLTLTGINYSPTSWHVFKRRENPQEV